MSLTLSKRVTCRADSRLYADISVTAFEESNSIVDNSSVVRWTVKASQVASSIISFVGTNRGNGCMVNLWVNGRSVMQKYVGLLNTPDSWTETGIYGVPHNADGNKTCPVVLEIVAGAGNFTNDPWTYGAASKSGNLKLAYLDRLSDITADSFVLGSKGSLTIKPKSDKFTHKLTYNFESVFGIIADKPSSNTISWTPELALAKEIPTKTSALAKITCETWLGDTKIGAKAIQKRLYVPSSVKPSFSGLSAAVVNPTAIKDWGIYVQGHSKCKLTINKAEGSYGSTIKTCHIKGAGFSGTASSLETGTLNQSGDLTFRAWVSDSRGRISDVKTVKISVVPYKAPVISDFSSERCIADGTPNDEGTCVLGNVTISYSDCSGKNKLSTYVHYRKRGATTWTDAKKAYTSGKDFVFGNAELSAESSYEIEYSFKDAFGTGHVIDLVSTAAVLMDFKAGGTGVAVGKIAEHANSLEINPDWKFYCHGSEIGEYIVDKVFPVGSIYLSMLSTNPGSYLGGTWVQISQGRFLLGMSSAYKVGQTGGEDKHTLTIEEMPGHKHSIQIANTANEETGFGALKSGSFTDRLMVNSKAKSITNETGSSHAHNNMPPYFVCYMWRRTK